MEHILSTLAFYAKYNGWQSFDKRCRSTRNAVKALEKRGFLEVNQFHQVRFTGKTFSGTTLGSAYLRNMRYYD
jgi:hypothetical protein